MDVIKINSVVVVVVVAAAVAVDDDDDDNSNADDFRETVTAFVPSLLPTYCLRRMY